LVIGDHGSKTTRGKFTLVMVADISPNDVEAFAEYEDVVLRLMNDHRGLLERRLRSEDGTFEAQLVSFRDRAAFEAYMFEPQRVHARTLLEGRDITQRVEIVRDV
jgi:hypothetical protein